MNTFDGKFYLDNLDHVINGILENNTKAGFGKNFSGYLNCAFGDKHWYDNETAFKVVQYYLWEAKFDPVKDAKIIRICQKLETNRNLSNEERFQLDLAKKVCSPLPSPSERILFNLVADEFGAGSRLEGAQSAEIIEYIVKFINARNSRYKIDAELMKEIQTAMVLSLSIDQEENSYPTETSDFIPKAMEKLTQAFKTGQPFLLPGGWVGKPSGHAMYFEVVPQNDGTASFRLYNLGSGIEKHQRAILFGKKREPKKAFSHLDESLRILHYFDNQHQLLLAKTLHLIACASKEMQDNAKAHENFEKALKIHRDLFEEDHPLIQSVLQDLKKIL